MRSRRTTNVWVALLLLTITASVVTAQDHVAEAEQRFRDGKKLMAEKKFAEACTAFETSQRLDPDISTLINLADCREKNAQVQSAWIAFLEVERQTRGDQKQAALNKTAKERAIKLEARLSYLTVSVSRDNDVEGLALTRNGAPFDQGLWNTAMPVNGGSYVIAGRAPGHEEWSTTVTVPDENGRISVDVPRFKEVEKLVEAPRPGGKPAESETRGDERTPSAFTPRRKVALGVGAAGLLALGGGVVFGLRAMGFEQDASDLCPAVTACARADEADALADKARAGALYANVSYGLGAAAVVTAAVLWYTGAPNRVTARAAIAPVVTPTTVGFDVAMRF